MAYNRIELPTLVREPLPWNLLEVAEDVTPGNDRWTAGIAWRNDIADAARVWNPNLSGEDFVEKDLTPSTADALEDNLASVLYGTYVCANDGSSNEEDTEIVRRRLTTGTAAGVESLFWDWAFDIATAVATGTPAEVVSQLGQAMSDSGLATQGILHLPSRSAERYLGASGFNPSQGNMPLTNRGDRISVGAGYPNVGSATSQWVIVSGPVGYLLSDIEVMESPENVVKTNQKVLLAERFAALQVDSAPLFKGLIEFTDEYILEGGAP